jgi:hypothetical protein
MTAPTPQDGRLQLSNVHDLHPHPQPSRNVLSVPLTDPHERARIGIPTGDNETIPIVIELNLAHPDGLAGAYEVFIELWSERMPVPPPEPFEEYIRILLTMTQVRSLARDDQSRPAQDRAIHRIWPDFPVDILDAITEPDQAR